MRFPFSVFRTYVYVQLSSQDLVKPMSLGLTASQQGRLSLLRPLGEVPCCLSERKVGDGSVSSLLQIGREAGEVSGSRASLQRAVTRHQGAAFFLPQIRTCTRIIEGAWARPVVPEIAGRY